MYHCLRKCTFTDKKTIYKIIIWLLFICSSQNGWSADTLQPFVYSQRKIDVCGDPSAKQVVAVVGIGKVKTTDAFFGCNFQLSYNRSKIIFNSALYLNTLSEFLEFQQVGFTQDGKIIGAVTTFGNVPVAGDLPLIAFLGHYIDNCPDTSLITIDFIEFTDEYKKVVSKYIPGIISGEIIKNSKYFLELKSNKDSLILNENEIESYFNISATAIPDSNLKFIDFEIELLNNKYFEISDISSLDSNIRIDSLNYSIASGKYTLKTTVSGLLNGNEILKVKIKQNKKIKETAEILLKAVKVDTCSCVSKFIDKNIKLVSKVNDTLSVSDLNNNYVWNYSRNNQELYLESEIELTNLKIYSVLGNEIIDITLNNDKTSGVSLKQYANGIYLVLIENLKKETKRIILIKN